MTPVVIDTGVLVSGVFGLEIVTPRQFLGRLPRHVRRQFQAGYLPTGQAVSTNLSRKAGGMERPVSRRASR
jgi:hypothetical protein